MRKYKKVLLVLVLFIIAGVILTMSFYGSQKKQTDLESKPSNEINVFSKSETEQQQAQVKILLPDVNENGFFTKAFSKAIDPNVEVEYSNGAKLFYDSLPDENKKILDSVLRAGEVYEYARLTFYPNGKVKISYKITDKVYDAFAASSIFEMVIPKTADKEYDYAVDPEGETIIVTDGIKYFINLEDGTIYREFLLTKEVFSIDEEVLSASNEPETDSTYIKLANIPYGSDESDPRNRMDIFVPKNLDASKENGAFIFIYGGGWTDGSKDGMWSTAIQYVDAGYVSVAINMHNAYFNEKTKKTESTVFDMLNDVHASVKKLKELSDKDGWNITQIALYGGSSGANIAMLYAYSRGADVTFFNTEEVLPVRFIVDLVGPVDMHDYAWGEAEDWENRPASGAGPLYAMLLTGAVNNPDLTEEEKEKYINAMSPVFYVETNRGVPTVMGYSEKDFIQNPNNGKILKSYLDKKLIKNDLFIFPNSNHGAGISPEDAKAFFDKTIEYAKTYFVSK